MRSFEVNSGRKSAAKVASWAVLFALSSMTLGCSFFRKAEVPMPKVVIPVESDAACAVVLLPGRFGSGEDFLDAEFPEIVAERGLDIQVVAADAHLGYYRDLSIVDRLHADVVQPLLDQGKEVWLVGTSMGGLGTFVYTRERPDDVSGLVAIAPFLGKEDLVAEMVAAGGPLKWTPPPGTEFNTVEGLWGWIIENYAEGPPLPTVLAYGEKDRVRFGGELFATLIPEQNTVTIPGGHDWSVWTLLWAEILDRGLVCGQSPS